MADHSKPVLASTYTNVLSELDGRLDDLALGLDSVNTTPTNLPTNAKRWNSSANKWEKWSGTAWSDMAATYAISISGNAGTVTNGVVTSGSYADPAWITSLAGAKISGNITGNAATATTLATARNINGVSFNGSANISVNLNNNLTFNNGGSGAASGVNFNGGTAATISYNTIGAPSTTGTGASGTWGISISGNAATATAATSATNATNADYATAAGRAYPRRSDGTDLNFYWSGQSGQPSWLWGGNDGTSMYVYNPSNFSVNYANSAGTANDGFGISQTWQVVSRSTGTWYQNTTARAISLWYRNIYGGGRVYVGPTTSSYVDIDYNDLDSDLDGGSLFIIPKGHYYYIVNALSNGSYLEMR